MKLPVEMEHLVTFVKVGVGNWSHDLPWRSVNFAGAAKTGRAVCHTLVLDVGFQCSTASIGEPESWYAIRDSGHHKQ